MGSGRLIVIDLDGTLLKVNSFSKFTLWAFREALKQGRIGEIWRIGCAVILRKLRIITHSDAKSRILTSAGKFLNEPDYASFAEILMRFVRPEVSSLIEKGETEGEIICLATAAPELYAKLIGQRIGASHILATRSISPGEDIEECRGEIKWRQVVDLCRRNDYELSIVMTDHYDDLPLIKGAAKEGGRVILTEPSPATIEKVKSERISSEILRKK